MSGGSWEYVSFKVNDAASRLMEKGQTPLRRVLGKRLALMAKALHEIEWVDSGDTTAGSDEQAIREALGDQWGVEELGILVEDARRLVSALSECLARFERGDGQKTEGGV